MGGLINSSTVKGDLWMIEAGGSMSCYPLSTTAEGPGPRVGHASLLVGNAFIVYGGDTKIDEADVLDETLYLLNTCKFWCLSAHTDRRFLDLFRDLHTDMSLQQRDNGLEHCRQDPDHQGATDTHSTSSDPRFISLAVK
jgi:hypothetical protein